MWSIRLDYNIKAGITPNKSGAEMITEILTQWYDLEFYFKTRIQYYLSDEVFKTLPNPNTPTWALSLHLVIPNAKGAISPDPLVQQTTGMRGIADSGLGYPNRPITR